MVQDAMAVLSRLAQRKAAARAVAHEADQQDFGCTGRCCNCGHGQHHRRLFGRVTELMSIEVVLLDLDGVIRHFDKSRVPAIEQHHGLPDGILRKTAFGPELLELAITGQITRAEWTKRVGEMVGSRQAASEWLNNHGVVDTRMIAVAREVRAAGCRVAVLTNGTETVPDELAGQGIAHEFDAVYTTAAIGFAKPDRRAFEHVCRDLGVAPQQVFFTDDTPSKLSGAIEIGIRAVAFTTVTALRNQLTELAILPQCR